MQTSSQLSLYVRLEVLRGLHRFGSGHYGGSMSCIDILVAIFSTRDLACVNGSGDRLLLSKGHASMALYVVLSACGKRKLPLDTFGKFGSPLQGHPDKRRLPEIDFSFGSLGQGIAVGLGLAFALRKIGHHVWVIVGDGECQEGMIWEAAMVAARYRLPNLHVIVDANGEQECGWGHDKTLSQEPVQNDAAKWRSFGWHVSECNGHDLDALQNWIGMHNEETRLGPTVLLARTCKGFESGPVMSGFRNHATHLSEDEYLAIKSLLGTDLGDVR